MSDNNFSTLFDLLPIGAYRCTADGRLIRANATLARLNGYASETDMLAATGDPTIVWYVEPTRREAFLRLIQKQNFVSDFVSEVYRHKTRERVWIREHAHVVRDALGQVAYYEGTIEDIAGERAAQQKLATSERRFRAMTEKAQVITIVCNADGVIVYASQATQRLLGVAPEQILNTRFFDLIHPDDRDVEEAEFNRLRVEAQSGKENVARYRHADGGWRYLAWLGKNALDDDSVAGVIVNFRDVTDSRLAEAQLKRQATIDMLTGLQNRSAFEAFAFAALESARAAGTRVALYFIDLDRFKAINDSAGHAVGDEVLRVVGRRLAHDAPDNAVISRLGGDEFAILLPRLEPTQDPERIAAQIIERVATPIVVHDQSFVVTTSVGLCLYPDHADSFETLLQHADLAMLDAKAKRRNAFRVFDYGLVEGARERATLLQELRVALVSHQLEVFYQPQVALMDAEVVGLEALVRWWHPVRGLIAPDVFIQIAEDAGLIGVIGQIVAEQAVRDVARWQKSYAWPLTLALNVSAQLLRDTIFIDQLRDVLLRNAFVADHLNLEITESTFVASIELAPAVMRALYRLGARIVLGDLGVAYSSFSHLKQFPVRGVKLDRGFVMGVPSDGTDAAIVRAIISLARSLKLRVVAEGIEYPEQRSYLIDQGCPEGQGYLFARPMPAAAMDALFESARHAEGQRLLLPPNRNAHVA